MTVSVKEERLEIKLGGFGGQGIISAGYLLGKAAALFDGRFATMTQSYGPESRGGACSSLVVIVPHAEAYPAMTHLDFLAVMSQEAAETYGPQAGHQTVVLVDRDLVTWRRSPKAIKVPAIAIAESLGNKLAANVAMLGALCRVMEGRPGGVTRRALEQAVASQFKKSIVDLNMKALAAGYDWEEPEDPRQAVLEVFAKTSSPG